MKIGLIDVDSKNYPNIPLMKLSAYHKQQGDSVEWYTPFVMIYDKEHCHRQYKDLQRWVNNRFIFAKCKKFEDYVRN